MSLTEKNSYWTMVCEQMEQLALENIQKEAIGKYDFSVTLPAPLRKKIQKILPYEYDDFDQNVFIEESSVETPVSFGEDEDEEGMGAQKAKKKKKEEEFNESTCSEIERLEHEYPRFVLNIDKPLEHSIKKKKKQNWASTYICQPRKNRVHWASKIYKMETSMAEKTLDEQAEQLMDASAERFTSWLNALGTKNQPDLTKEKLKALFSIEGERRLLSSIMTDPKEVHAIAKTVADRWKKPEMAIELKYENYIKKRLQNRPKKILTVAFGRTIPVKDRPWVPGEFDDPITTVYPDELLSLEKLFKGIAHLRSSKALANFYKANPKLKKPRYLVKAGLFKEKTVTQTVAEVPLYEKLKLKY